MALPDWPDWSSKRHRTKVIEGVLLGIPISLLLGFLLPHVSSIPQFAGTISGTLVATGTVGYALFGMPVGEDP